MNLSDLIQLAIHSVRYPRNGMRQVLAVDWDRSIRWQMLMLVVVLSLVLGQFVAILTGDHASVVLGGYEMSTAVGFGIIQIFVLVIAAHAIDRFGRLAGGEGNLDGAILLVAWLQFILLCVQVLQLVFLVVMPPLAALIGLLAFGLFFWLLTSFVAELHGFRSLIRTFVGIIAVTILISLVISMILSFVGIDLRLSL